MHTSHTLQYGSDMLTLCIPQQKQMNKKNENEFYDYFLVFWRNMNMFEAI